MDFLICRIAPLALTLMCLTGFGSCLRLVPKPQPFDDTTDVLNISCITDGPNYWAKSIVSIQIMKQNEPTMAVINNRQQLTMAAGSHDNMKAEGHVDTKDASESRLTLNIEKPDRQDAGIYRCLVFFTDESFRIKEEEATGNVTYQKQDITVTLLLRNQEHNKTLQTLTKQHVNFMDVHSRQKQDIDILTDKIDTVNKTNTEQYKDLDKLKDHQSKQKQDIDILNDEMDRQNNTDMKLTKLINKQSTLIDRQNTLIDKLTRQIDTLNKDNTDKQQQLDTYIKKQNETNKKYETQLQNMAKKLAVLGPDWKYYEADRTFNKAFRTDGISERLNWSDARKECQTFDGGDLVIIRDETKNKFVYNLFEGARKYNTWIGLKNNATVGFDFQYVDGSDMGSYHLWSGSNPHGDTDVDEKCVAMNTGTRLPEEWYDDDCSKVGAYVCSVSSTGIF